MIFIILGFYFMIGFGVFVESDEPPAELSKVQAWIGRGTMAALWPVLLGMIIFQKVE
jgi:hypothetical protein